LWRKTLLALWFWQVFAYSEHTVLTPHLPEVSEETTVNLSHSNWTVGPVKCEAEVKTNTHYITTFSIRIPDKFTYYSYFSAVWWLTCLPLDPKVCFKSDRGQWIFNGDKNP
jgi:hypothetical protein